MRWVCDGREELSGPFPASSPARARPQGPGVAHSCSSCNCSAENPILGNCYFVLPAQLHFEDMIYAQIIEYWGLFCDKCC